MRKIISGTLISTLFYTLLAFNHWSYLLEPKIIAMFIMGIIASYYQADYNPFKTKNNSIDQGTVLHIIWTVYLVQSCALAESFYFNYPESMKMDLLSYFSLAVALFGLWFRSWAYLTLGKFFTMHLETKTGQKVIEDGPYKYIRHPSYTGAYLTYVFNPLFFKSYFSTGLALVLLGWAFYRRIGHEEAMLMDQLGRPYKEFCEKRWRLLPGVW